MLKKNIYFYIYIISLLFLCLFLNPNIINAAGTTYFVSTDGLDTNIGTINSPFKSITKGISVVGAGDILYVRGGTYPSFVVTKSGNSSQYLTISTYNGEKVLITGGTEQISLKGTSYVKISGFETKGATASWGASIHLQPSNGLSPQYNIIEKNTVHDNLGSNTSGILVEDGSYNKIVDNEVYNNYFCGIQVLSHPIQSPNGITGNEIIGNISHNNTLSGGDSDGIKVEGPGTKNTLILNNIMYENSDDGLDTWDSSHNLVVGNIAYNQKGAGDGNGFKLGGSQTGGYNTVKQNIAHNNKSNGFDTNGTWGNVYYNNVAYGNTLFGFEDGYREFSCNVQTCPSVYINNIGYNNGKGNLSANIYTSVSHNNIWYSDSGSTNISYKYVNYNSLPSFYLASGNRLDNPNNGLNSSFSLNPNFVDPLNSNFKLKSNSDAIDKGDITNPGQIKSSNTVDIGAFEYENIANSTPVSTPMFKLGDANNDNFINDTDYQNYWLPNYLTNLSCGIMCGDFNSNGKIDGVDYVIWLINYGK